MNNCMTVVAVMAVTGLFAPGHAAQPERKDGKDRVRMEYGAVARKCDGLKGDARITCLKDELMAGNGVKVKYDAGPGRRGEKE